MLSINKNKMSVQFTSGWVVCTPDGFAMANRIARLKRELKSNQGV